MMTIDITFNERLILSICHHNARRNRTPTVSGIGKVSGRNKGTIARALTTLRQRGLLDGMQPTLRESDCIRKADGTPATYHVDRPKPRAGISLLDAATFQICKHASARGKTISFGYIVKCLGCSRRSAIRSVETLHDIGAVEKVSDRSGTRILSVNQTAMEPHYARPKDRTRPERPTPPPAEQPKTQEPKVKHTSEETKERLMQECIGLATKARVDGLGLDKMVRQAQADDTEFGHGLYLLRSRLQKMGITLDADQAKADYDLKRTLYLTCQ
jgi:hypothetical protein